jgi:Domain of unknown function (DUF1330)
VDDVIAAAATTGVTEPDRRRDMSAFAIAHLRTPQLNDDVFEYLERIQATLDPYEGRFRVYEATVEVIEDRRRHRHPRPARSPGGRGLLSGQRPPRVARPPTTLSR